MHMGGFFVVRDASAYRGVDPLARVEGHLTQGVVLPAGLGHCLSLPADEGVKGLQGVERRPPYNLTGLQVLLQ